MRNICAIIYSYVPRIIPYIFRYKREGKNFAMNSFAVVLMTS